MVFFRFKARERGMNNPHAKTRGAGSRRCSAGVLAAALALSMAAVALSACNTTEGLGKDVSATGHAVTSGASKVKSGM
jgi:predicted small secreted protein